MSPGGQSNLLLIRRLLLPRNLILTPIRGRFFAQVLRREKPQPDCAWDALGRVVVKVKNFAHTNLEAESSGWHSNIALESLAVVLGNPVICDAGMTQNLASLTKLLSLTLSSIEN
jgi:hypothetical protein